MATPNLSIKKRILFLLGFFFLVAMALIVRTGWLQIHDGEKLQKEAIEQQTRDRMIRSKRGTIFDRNGKPLAVSASVETVSAIPNEIMQSGKSKEIGDKLAEILSIDAGEVYKKITRKSSYEIIKRKIEKEQAESIRMYITENNIKGIMLDEDSKRYYPFGNFAAHLIGFAGTDNQGLNGIEIMFDKYLKGLPGRIVSAKNAIGTDMPYKFERYINPEDGVNVVLTIDEVIQHFVEKHLETAVIENKVSMGGAAIVMDVNSGEILAMSTKPDFDLNNPFTINNEDVLRELQALEGENYQKRLNQELQSMWRNKAVVDTYEPGSTFKIITSAAALEENEVKTSDHFNCSGSVTVGGYRLKCWRHYRPHGAQTFIEGVLNSCNPVFIELGLKTGAQAFYRYVKAFGFLEKTGIDLTGEAVGLFHQLSNFNELELATAAFGQGFQVTPLQMITAISAVANGGNLLKPKIVKQFTDKDGNVLKSFENRVVRQVISQETSKIMRETLESVVSEGTGKNAYVKGYRVAGKTGTSEKLPRGSGKYIASFIGFAPADNPQVAALIMLDEPIGEAYYGGVIASPVIGKILDDTLRYLGVETKFTEQDTLLMEIKVPEVRNLEINQAEKQLKSSNLLYKVEGTGNIIIDQLPKPGARLPEKSMVILYTENATLVSKTVVPNVIGKSVMEANKMLKNSGLNIKVSGFGTALSQAPEAGLEVPPGSIINVNFMVTEVD